MLATKERKNGRWKYQYEFWLKGILTYITKTNAVVLSKIGVVTDVVSLDFDTDRDQYLVREGEWMPITFLENDKGRLENIILKNGMDKTVGWWVSRNSLLRKIED